MDRPQGTERLSELSTAARMLADNDLPHAESHAGLAHPHAAQRHSSSRPDMFPPYPSAPAHRHMPAQHLPAPASPFLEQSAFPDTRYQVLPQGMRSQQPHMPPYHFQPPDPSARPRAISIEPLHANTHTQPQYAPSGYPRRAPAGVQPQQQDDSGSSAEEDNSSDEEGLPPPKRPPPAYEPYGRQIPPGSNNSFHFAGQELPRVQPHPPPGVRVSALQAATLMNDMDRVKSILSQALQDEGRSPKRDEHNLDLAEAQGNTALHLALKHERFEIAKLLIEAGASITKANNSKLTPIEMIFSLNASHFASFAGVVTQCLNELEGEPKAHLLRVACGFGSLLAVQKLLSTNIDINSADERGMTALMIAAAKNHQEIVAKLVQKRTARLNAQDRNGWTALHWAVACEAPNSIVTLLPCKKLTPTISNYKGETVLHFAAREGRLDLANQLLIGVALAHRKLLLTATTDENQTVIDYAMRHSDQTADWLRSMHQSICGKPTGSPAAASTGASTQFGIPQGFAATPPVQVCPNLPGVSRCMVALSVHEKKSVNRILHRLPVLAGSWGSAARGRPRPDLPCQSCFAVVLSSILTN
eukprot:m.574865 g.574865  ORF g.574865 m.574865 type:complete len:587 (-) comp57885_c0_seq17:193-1953(-)